MSGPSTQPTIDPEIPQRLHADLGADIARRLLESFAEEALTRTDAVIAAAKADTPTDLRSAAHALRSVSLEYGAVELADMAGAIEGGGPADPAALRSCCETSVAALKAAL